MLRVCRSSLVTATGLVLLAAMLVCPVMASAATAAPVVASCHERPESDDHGGAIGSVTCCTGVTAATPQQPAHGDGAVPQFGLGSAPSVAPFDTSPADPLRAGGTAPPLFVQHAALRI